MKIFLATDHQGYEKKESLKKYLSKKYEVVDLGTTSKERVDYPIYAFKLGESVVKEKAYGILICGTGIGMSIAANKVSHVHCAKIDSKRDAYFARQHNHANVLAMSARKSLYQMKKMVDCFFETEENKDPRYQKRIEMIENYHD